MVNGALVLGDHWHLSRIFLGAVALAAITSLPNAYAAIRLALGHPGVVREAALHGLELSEVTPMPANNLSLVFVKTSRGCGT